MKLSLLKLSLFFGIIFLSACEINVEKDIKVETNKSVEHNVSKNVETEIITNISFDSDFSDKNTDFDLKGAIKKNIDGIVAPRLHDEDFFSKVKDAEGNEFVSVRSYYHAYTLNGKEVLHGQAAYLGSVKGAGAVYLANYEDGFLQGISYIKQDKEDYSYTLKMRYERGKLQESWFEKEELDRCFRSAMNEKKGKEALVSMLNQMAAGKTLVKFQELPCER